jgi:zinc D-Ala-D-Ala carboxypeptidase
MSDITSKNFTDTELACKCCGVNGMKPVFVKLLQELRDLYGRPIILTSAYRCKKHNEAIKGAKGSQHCLGLAVDIHCVDVCERDELLDLSFQLGFRGRGIDKAFLHLDLRVGPKVTFVY